MSFTAETYDGANVLVLGGTGAQGLSVVKALSASGKYTVSVLTRYPQATESQALARNYDVRLVEGSYTTEQGLRDAFDSQDVVYFNIDIFSTGEPLEYFWTFRAYEIAVQSGVKWFIYSGAHDGFQRYGYDERYRNNHNVVAWRLSSWLASQPQDKMKWTIITGGVYAEMLGRLLRPVKEPGSGKLVFKVPMRPESVMPLLPLERYGQRVLWALRHPRESYGHFLSCSPFQVPFLGIAEAFQKATGVETAFEPITIDQWMEVVRIHGFTDPDKLLPRGSRKDDPTAFTFRKSFGAWWAIWSDNEVRKEYADDSWLDEIQPDVPRTLEAWMREVGYNGGLLSGSPRAK